MYKSPSSCTIPNNHWLGSMLHLHLFFNVILLFKLDQQIMCRCICVYTCFRQGWTIWTCVVIWLHGFDKRVGTGSGRVDQNMLSIKCWFQVDRREYLRCTKIVCRFGLTYRLYYKYDHSNVHSEYQYLIWYDVFSMIWYGTNWFY